MSRTLLRRLVPLELKKRLLIPATRMMLPDATLDRIQLSEGRVTVAGLLSSPSGIGEGARLACERFAGLGYTVGAIDLTAHLRCPGGVRFSPPDIRPEDVGGPLIIHLNPPAFQVALLRFLRGNRDHRKLIAAWAWELPRVPAEWQAAFRLAHEVWVPSDFVAKALRTSGCQTEIRVVPHPISIPAPPAPPGTDDGCLTVLTVFAYDSGFNRKNPIGAVAAFRRAFGHDTSVRMVIKSRSGSETGEPEQRLRAAIGDAGNIEILHGDLSRDAYRNLVSSCDIFLSMHRAEGFGIPLAEAMVYGKPVVATRWSGNLDFMSDEAALLVPGGLILVADKAEAYRAINQAWADPDIEIAAGFLRQLRDPVLRRRLGATARQHVITCLGPAAFADAIGDAV